MIDSLHFAAAFGTIGRRACNSKRSRSIRTVLLKKLANESIIRER